MVSEDDRLTGWAVVIVNFYRNVGHRLGLTTRTQISVCKSPFAFCKHRSVPVLCENGSAETTVAEGGQNLVARLWGRTLGESWPPEPTSSCLHRLLMSTGCKSSHNGFLDVSRSNGRLRISGWIGQLSCLTIFSTSLSVAAFLRRAGGLILDSTGSHGRGVERRVPEMRRMVEFNCTSTRLVWAQRDQTGAQYSAAE